jgi:hypothetical protein
LFLKENSPHSGITQIFSQFTEILNLLFSKGKDKILLKINEDVHPKSTKTAKAAAAALVPICLIPNGHDQPNVCAPSGNCAGLSNWFVLVIPSLF